MAVPDKINNLGEQEIFLTGLECGWLPRLPVAKARADGDCLPHDHPRSTGSGPEG